MINSQIPEALAEQGNRTLGEWLMDVEEAQITADSYLAAELEDLAEAIRDTIVDQVDGW